MVICSFQIFVNKNAVKFYVKIYIVLQVTSHNSTVHRFQGNFSPCWISSHLQSQYYIPFISVMLFLSALFFALLAWLADVADVSPVKREEEHMQLFSCRIVSCFWNGIFNSLLRSKGINVVNIVNMIQTECLVKSSSISSTNTSSLRMPGTRQVQTWCSHYEYNDIYGFNLVKFPQFRIK